ncbi:protein NO VEIN domain-containing protein [Kribbella endophytica]
MRHILLTWNPGPNNDKQWTPDQWQRSMVRGAASGRAPGNRWSIGRRTRGIEQGDRGYLYRQGEHGRGIVALAEIMRGPHFEPDWRDREGDAGYAGLRWLDCLPLEEMLTLDELESHVPNFAWRKVYSSGREVPGEEGRRLADLWADRTLRMSPLPDAMLAGAGFGESEANRRVEKAAVDFVVRAYRAEKYSVRSVERDHCGWDLTVSRGEDALHVEVKGASGPLPRFFLTANEYQHAAIDPRWRLVIVTNALTDPTWHEIGWPEIRDYSAPALHRVQVPLEVFR